MAPFALSVPRLLYLSQMFLAELKMRWPRSYNLSVVLLAGVANPRRGCQLSELQGWVDNSGYCLRDEIFNFSGSLRPKT